jgi:hypothetical protein
MELSPLPRNTRSRKASIMALVLISMVRRVSWDDTSQGLVFKDVGHTEKSACQSRSLSQPGDLPLISQELKACLCLRGISIVGSIIAQLLDGPVK